MEHVSKGSHTVLGHTEQTPQSCWHEAQFSVPVQRPSPQPGQLPQSAGQLKQFSIAGLHEPLPQASHAPQSGAQERQSSGGLQKPSSQAEHVPQSPGHDEQVSAASHVPLPQLAQSPQSSGQLAHVSVEGSQIASPHPSHCPQSSTQVPQLSPASQAPLPQLWQTPQSPGQLEQDSPSPQVPSPHPAHRPQSGKHVEQVSPPLQMASPHPAPFSPPPPAPSRRSNGADRPHEAMSPTVNKKSPKMRFMGAEAYTVSVTPSDKPAHEHRFADEGAPHRLPSPPDKPARDPPAARATIQPDSRAQKSHGGSDPRVSPPRQGIGFLR